MAGLSEAKYLQREVSPRVASGYCYPDAGASGLQSPDATAEGKSEIPPEAGVRGNQF